MTNSKFGKSVFWAILPISLFSSTLFAQTNIFPSSGNVGIGTTVPSEKLDIDGNIKILSAHNRGVIFQRYSDKLPSSIKGLPGEYSTRQGISFNTSSIDGAMSILWNGNVGIGTTVPDTKLTVKGNIHAEEVKVDLSVPGPDYVFKEDYELTSLEEVQNYIKEKGHLPNIPSAKEMEENGIQLGELNMKLLEKIEELTLYILEQEEKLKKVDELKIRILHMERLVKKLVKNQSGKNH
ncbi:hypothetical protein ACOKFD_16860 [Flagellimonas sp. S174]|uniref:hypothetical protein n=1 Tax=Flagellimonas sp. S174 TaxID=3410790 RepID=UPI003BF5900F